MNLWVSYGRRIWNDRIAWKIQLKVNSAFGGDSPKGVVTQPWGDIAIARLPPERRWYLTNTFDF